MTEALASGGPQLYYLAWCEQCHAEDTTKHLSEEYDKERDRDNWAIAHVTDNPDHRVDLLKQCRSPDTP